MEKYRLLIKPSAQKELEAAGTQTIRIRIVERIQSLASNPRGAGCEKLAGFADRYRVRQGNYRIVYTIDDERREVTIQKVGHRREVYR